MGKNIADLRFAVKRKDGFISNLWRLWATKHGDIYLTTRGQGGVHKYSFHKSGICRSAFTSEHGTPAGLSDRATEKWKKTPVPQAGTNQFSRLVWLGIPTDFLSRQTKEERKQVLWIPAAPSNQATFIELGITADSESDINQHLPSDKNLLLFKQIVDGEAMFVRYYYDTWENKELSSPGTEGSLFPDLLFSPKDPDDTGRPVRIIFGPRPSNYDALILQELGGYKISA